MSSSRPPKSVSWELSLYEVVAVLEWDMASSSNWLAKEDVGLVVDSSAVLCWDGVLLSLVVRGFLAVALEREDRVVVLLVVVVWVVGGPEKEFQRFWNACRPGHGSVGLGGARVASAYGVSVDEAMGIMASCGIPGS